MSFTLILCPILAFYNNWLFLCLILRTLKTS
uniref:Uncharacterized protein n=1 Tax=Myoviridae sp. ctaUM17 TaxID=2825133 RepID=A0A8S5TWK1_9CAUD|nr:MAG TPA: hypothetical protein [Myoviridae sp. ctaUM17]